MQCCRSPCFYCGCNRVITRDVGKGRAYVQRVLREAAMMAACLFMAPELLGELLQGLRGLFRFSEQPEPARCRP